MLVLAMTAGNGPAPPGAVGDTGGALSADVEVVDRPQEVARRTCALADPCRGAIPSSQATWALFGLGNEELWRQVEPLLQQHAAARSAILDRAEAEILSTARWFDAGHATSPADPVGSIHPESASVVASAVRAMGHRLIALDEEFFTTVRHAVTENLGPAGLSQVDRMRVRHLQARSLVRPGRFQGLIGAALDVEAFLNQCPGCPPGVIDLLAHATCENAASSPSVASVRTAVEDWNRESEIILKRLCVLGVEASADALEARIAGRPTASLASVRARRRAVGELQRSVDTTINTLAHAMAAEVGPVRSAAFLCAYRTAAYPRAFPEEASDALARWLLRTLEPGPLRDALREAHGEHLVARDAIERELLSDLWSAVIRHEDPFLPESTDGALSTFQLGWQVGAARRRECSDRFVAGVLPRLPPSLLEQASAELRREFGPGHQFSERRQDRSP